MNEEELERLRHAYREIGRGLQKVMDQHRAAMTEIGRSFQASIDRYNASKETRR